MGFYTGKIYGPNVKTEDIKECCQVLNVNDPEFDPNTGNIQNFPEYLRLRDELRKRCYGCYGCPESTMIKDNE